MTKNGSTYRKFHLSKVPLIEGSTYPNKIREVLLMQIQGTGEIGSTKRKFHLSRVPLIESRLYMYIDHKA